MKISVLMPVYNRESFLERSIGSIQNQSHKDLQILIYNDGSSDDSLKIIKDLQQNDRRIMYVYGIKNNGVAYARNVLLDMCDTKYACWMDSDDISHPKRIEKQLSVIKPDTMVYCTWENLAKKKAGTTRGFATLMFPVDHEIRFPSNMNFGSEDAVWRELMEQKYKTIDVNDVLYSIDFHGDRIGTWKRKIDKNWNGAYDLKDIKHLSYEETLEKYKNEHL
jgi:glycosyltransferase involved in cell wall biosynthesis